MPINAKVKADIERQVTEGKMDRTYANSLISTLDNAPDEFQSGFMAGPDYMRQSQALKADRDSHQANVTKWKEWEAKSQKTLDETAAREVAAQARVRELEAAVAGGGLNLNDENAVLKEINGLKTHISTLQDNLKSAGFVTKTDIEKIAEERDGRLLNWFGNHMSDRQKVTDEYQAAFGKPMSAKDYDELITFATEKQKELGRTVPLTDAYGMKYGADLKEKERAFWKAEGAKEAEARLNVPGGGSPQGGGAGFEKGPLGQRMEEWKGKDLTPNDGDLMAAKARAVDALRGL